MSRGSGGVTWAVGDTEGAPGGGGGQADAGKEEKTEPQTVGCEGQATGALGTENAGQ